MFTREDLNNMPTFEDRVVNSLLTDIEFTEDGVKKKLDKLKPEKKSRTRWNPSQNPKGTVRYSGKTTLYPIPEIPTRTHSTNGMEKK